MEILSGIALIAASSSSLKSLVGDAVTIFIRD
jgi:hypothetical protein